MVPVSFHNRKMRTFYESEKRAEMIVEQVSLAIRMLQTEYSKKKKKKKKSVRF